MDTFTTLWNRVLLRVPAAGPDLSQDLIRDAFNQLVARRQWSWLTKPNTFYAPTYVTTGTISTTNGSAVVTGSGTAWTAGYTGIQMRIGSVGGSAYPTYSIIQVPSTTSIVLDRPWVGPSLTGSQYTIFQCYFPVPSDFQEFYSVINPTANYRLNHLATQAEFDSYDPQRAQSGIAYALAFYDFTQNSQGSITPAVQVNGTGTAPVSTTTVGYSYPQASLYSIKITTGGDSGTAEFSWAQDSGTTSATGILTDSAPVDLSNGVQAYFPTGTYVVGDIFVIACYPDTTRGVARYEMWPRPVDTPYTYPYLYIVKLPDLTDESPTLPPPIASRGDVLVEMALTNLALWPGTSNQPNPYRDVSVSNVHRITAEKLIYELEKKDDEIAIKDLVYQGLPFMGPWQDGSWLQRHAIYPY